MNTIARALLESKAVHIKPNPKDYFTWTSGIKSPIYCNNRNLISYHKYRTDITNQFVAYIKKHFPAAELIAGTATAGIPWAAWIADKLELPMVYIRSKPKGHGLKTAIEGQFKAAQKTIIIEDLISTGKSSLAAYHHCKEAKLDTLSVLSIFNYQFRISKENFETQKLNNHSLCELNKLLSYAHREKILSGTEIEMVKEWRDNY